MTISIKELISYRSKKIELGTTVLARSNEDEPLMMGHLVRYDNMHSSEIPIVLSLKDNKEYGIMGFVFPFTPELWSWLSFLHPKEQWRILENEFLRTNQ